MKPTDFQPTASIEHLGPDAIELLVQEARNAPAELARLFYEIRGIRAQLYNAPAEIYEAWLDLSKLCQRLMEFAEQGSPQGPFNSRIDRGWSRRDYA